MTNSKHAGLMDAPDDADPIDAAAAIWHAGIDRADFDWSGFTLWLEADPRHRAAYDEIARIDALIGEHAAALMEHHVWTEEAIVPPRRSGHRWLMGAGGLIAAGVAALLLWPAALRPGDTVHATGDTAVLVALGDGSEVALAPHSRLAVAPDGQRLRLAGEALFTIRHQPGRTIAITAGALTITDIGTRFDVAAGQGGVRVAVAAGEVVVASAGFGAPVSLTPGRQLLYDAARDSATVTSLESAGIGAWRGGHLTYQAAPLSLVADDLARYALRPVVVAPGLRERRFSGTLALGGWSAGARGKAAGPNADGAQRALEDLAGLMGLGIVHGPHAILLVDRGGTVARR